MRCKPITNSVIDYDPSWPGLFREAEQWLWGCSSDWLAIHHVGSTSVPGLAAKSEIDMLIVVAREQLDTDYEPCLLSVGFGRGGDLALGHQFYKRDWQGVRTHKLHICVEGHPAIQEMLRFRDYLRRNNQARLDYQQLKLRLAAQCTDLSGYLEGKAPFIRAILMAS